MEQLEAVSEEKSVFNEGDGVQYFYSEGTGIGVVAKYREDLQCTAIGVSKCGPDDKPDSDLGLEIAEHRADVKPFACVPHDFDDVEFQKMAHVLASHLVANATWNQKGLSRIDNQKVDNNE